MSLIYLFSLFEAFNKDFFQTLFNYKPELMKSKEKKVESDLSLAFIDVGQAISFDHNFQIQSNLIRCNIGRNEKPINL